LDSVELQRPRRSPRRLQLDEPDPASRHQHQSVRHSGPSRRDQLKRHTASAFNFMSQPPFKLSLPHSPHLASSALPYCRQSLIYIDPHAFEIFEVKMSDNLPSDSSNPIPSSYLRQ